MWPMQTSCNATLAAALDACLGTKLLRRCGHLVRVQVMQDVDDMCVDTRGGWS